MNKPRLVGWLVRVVVALVFGLVVAASSRIPWNNGDEDRAQLRLSWGGIAPPTQACRAPSEEELAGLPRHMRPREICEGGAVKFSLRLVVDGVTLLEGPLKRGGRSARAYSVYHQLDIEPGRHNLVLDFWPDSTVVDLPADLHLSIHRTLDFAPGRATLLTLESGAFVVRTGR